MAMFQVVSGEAVLFTFRANFAREDSPIQVCDQSGEQSKDTPFRVSDSRRRPVAAAKLINDWCRVNGRTCWPKGSRGLILRRVR
jgi:hypothetical protein